MSFNPKYDDYPRVRADPKCSFCIVARGREPRRKDEDAFCCSDCWPWYDDHKGHGTSILASREMILRGRDH